MPLSSFQKKKLEQMFSIFDLNGDGRINWADYVRRMAALAEHCGWDANSPQYLRNHRFAEEEWAALCESADVDRDGDVTRDEFLRYGDRFLDNRSAVRAYARGDVQLLFDAMDTDADGSITVDDYRTFLEVSGADASAADAFFAHADIDRNGRITRSEMAHAFEEFLVSEDPGAGGNWLFGPLPDGDSRR